jgi:hypothetical protein
MLVSAISMYSATFGRLPRALADLTKAGTVGGITGGPFLKAIPTPPHGWSPYSYITKDDGTFTLSSKGDGTSVAFP